MSILTNQELEKLAQRIDIASGLLTHDDSTAMRMIAMSLMGIFETNRAILDTLKDINNSLGSIDSAVIAIGEDK